VEGYWKEGERCVLRGIVNHRVWLAQSVIVVRDAADETALLLLPGAECAFPEGYWRWKRGGDRSQGTRWQDARSDQLVLRRFAWQANRILILLEPEKYYSCFLFWDHEADRFSGYYINFQLAYRRSHCGFDTLDLDLDIVIDPQYDWKWKDLEDYHDGIEEGGIRDEWVQGVEQSHAEVFDRIQNRRYPLDGSWLGWQPEPAWAPPTLPERWRVV